MILENRGLVSASDLKEFEIHRQYLHEYWQNGWLSRVSRGVYALRGVANSPLALVSKRIPRGVFCLLSALHLHGLGPKPDRVWICVGPKDRIPSLPFPPLRPVRMSGESRTEGIEPLALSRTQIPVYGIAKTAADCLKFRTAIGVDVALSAVKKSVERGCTREQLYQFARICRVERILARLEPLIARKLDAPLPHPERRSFASRSE